MILFLNRGINLFIIAFSYLFSRLTGRVIHWGNPVAASIEPTNTCNLHCPECPTGANGITRPSGMMSPELFQKTIDQLSPHLSYLTLYFQGEPYMSRHLFDYIAYAKPKKIFVATSTNGHFLDTDSVKQTIESGLDQLIVSLDGPDQQTYEVYRKGGNLEKVVNGIRLLISEKRRHNSRNPKVILQCLVLKSNEQYLDIIRKLGKELDVDKIVFKSAQFYGFENGNPLMPDTRRHARYVRTMTKDKGRSTKCEAQIFKSSNPQIPFQPSYRIKNSLPNACFRMWSSCVITWDGKVVPCCFDKDASYILGDISKQSMQEIWNGKTISGFRQNILHDRKSIGICNNCTQRF